MKIASTMTRPIASVAVRRFAGNAALAEPMLLAVAKPRDVRAMRPEHEHADERAHREHRRPHANGDREQNRKHQRARQRSERHEAARQQHDGEDDQREQRLQRRERDEHAGRRRDALSAACRT